MSGDLLFERDGPIARVTFNRPQARNAITFPMYQRLREIFTELGDKKDAKVVIITGAGDKAFAAGTDINEFRAFSKPEDAIGYEERGEEVLSLIERTPVPVIAAISGACTGGGAGIAAACDIRIATRDARIGFPIARTLGNCLSMANYARLRELFGVTLAKEMIFTARLLGADEARAAGFLSEVVEDRAALIERASALATTLAGHAPLTLAATKEAFRRLREGSRDGDDLVVGCFMSRDFREGLEAFLAKRPPSWTGS